ncbi:MAG: hypothetical protein RBR22_04875 [Desulfuromonas sp.]|nr:hypothetical protein [Desulfuromonas sp.]
MILLHFFTPLCCAAPLRLNGNWSTPIGDDDGPWNLGQTYNLALSHDPTSAITLSGNFRYATTQQQGLDKTKTIAPSANFSLTNDIFRFNIAGAQNERQSGDDPTSINRNWSCNLSSNLNNPLWPQLRLSYSESNSTNDASPATIDTNTESFASSIDYRWRFISMLYNYRTSTSTDEISGTQNNSDSHASNIQFMKSLFNNRLSLSASHQYNINNSETSTTLDNGVLVIDVNSAAAFAALDNTPLTDPLTAVPQLNDGDETTATSVQIPTAMDMLNIALQINLQNITRVKIYFDRELTLATQQRLHWTFYTSQDNNLWTELALNPTLIYADDLGRSVAQFTFANTITSVRYIKAVLDSDAGFDSAYITEIQAQEEISDVSVEDKVSSKNTTENIQASVNYRPWSQWQIGYSFSRNTSNPQRGAKSVQDNHSLSSHLDLNRYFALSLSASENIDEVEDLATERTRSYAFSYQTSPLNNMNFSLNGTRSQYYVDNEQERLSDSISTNLSTVILPDLTANLSYTWNKSTSYVDDVTSSSDGYTFNLMARINERVNISYYYSYNETSTHRVALAYRPSEQLSFNTSAMLDDDTQNYSSSVHWRVTQKIQTDFLYSFNCADTGDTHNGRFNLSWNLSSYLSLRNSIDWTKSDDDSSWSGLLSASYNF